MKNRGQRASGERRAERDGVWLRGLNTDLGPAGQRHPQTSQMAAFLSQGGNQKLALSERVHFLCPAEESVSSSSLTGQSPPSYAGQLTRALGLERKCVTWCGLMAIEQSSIVTIYFL